MMASESPSESCVVFQMVQKSTLVATVAVGHWKIGFALLNRFFEWRLKRSCTRESVTAFLFNRTQSTHAIRRFRCSATIENKNLINSDVSTKRRSQSSDSYRVNMYSLALQPVRAVTDSRCCWSVDYHCEKSSALSCRNRVQVLFFESCCQRTSPSDVVRSLACMRRCWHSCPRQDHKTESFCERNVQ